MEKKIAILATDGVEKSELESPMQALKNEGFEVDLVGEQEGSIKSWDEGNWSTSFPVDTTVEEAEASDYDALVVPGGVINPDKLRRNEKALHFVRDFFQEHKPVASLCHGPQVLISAGVVKDRKMTSFHSIKDDLINAGAKWEDSPVVVDQGFVTSRHPGDLEQFNAKLIEEIKEGKHKKQHA